MQLGFKQKGGETDRMNERQTERERELVSLLCGGLDTDLQHLLSLIPANQKQEYEPLSSERGRLISRMESSLGNLTGQYKLLFL